LLDEPTSDLDPVGRADVLGVLDRMGAEGRTVVLVEHEGPALEHADAVVLLADGRVVACGPPAEVLADVSRCEAIGVRPPDVARVFAALGSPAPPLDLVRGAE